MQIGQEYYFNDGYTRISTSEISFGDGTVIPLARISQVNTSAPLVDLDWSLWKRKRYIVSAVLFLIGLLGFVVGIATSKAISADGLIAPDYIALLCLPVILFAIGLALYTIFKEHPKRARHYYIVIVLTDGTVLRRWWSDYDHRERIDLALSNARSYRG